MDNEYLIRKLTNLIKQKQNQLLEGKLLSSAVPNTLVDVQTKLGIKKALNLNITNTTDSVLVTKDVDNQLVAFSFPKTNNIRSTEIINRKLRPKKIKAELDAAILYAVKEEKSSPVPFVNPTWEIQLKDNTYTCVPVPHGYKGIFPTLNDCMIKANEYKNKAIQDAQATNTNRINSYNQQVANYEATVAAIANAKSNFSSALSSYLNATYASPPNLYPSRLVPGFGSGEYSVPDRYAECKIVSVMGEAYFDCRELYVGLYYDTLVAANSNPGSYPIYPELLNTSFNASNEEPSKTAFSFYIKTKIKSNPIKLLEINEKEIFEAILVKTKNSTVPVIKLGKAKLNELITDTGGGDGGSGTGSGGGGSTPSDPYWMLTDLHSWYKILFYNSLTQTTYSTNTYPCSINIFSKINKDYQLWRFSNYTEYPAIPSNKPCDNGIEYLNYTELIDKYKAVADYQSLTNNYSRFITEAVLDPSFNGKTYNFNEVTTQENNSPQAIKAEVILYKSSTVGNVCNKSEILSKKFDLELPANTVLLIIKGLHK